MSELPDYMCPICDVEIGEDDDYCPDCQDEVKRLTHHWTGHDLEVAYMCVRAENEALKTCISELAEALEQADAIMETVVLLGGLDIPPGYLLGWEEAHEAVRAALSNAPPSEAGEE